MKRVFTQASIIVAAPVARALLFGMAFVFVLGGTSSSQAAGFNVNSDVNFTPLTATYNTVSDTTGCPAGSVGKFLFRALLTNKPTSPAIPDIEIHALTLTNGNVLLDPQTGAVLGGEGAVMQVPKVGQYADGLLSAGESVEVPSVMCLRTFQPFQFFVDVFGIVTKLVSVNRFGTNSGDADSAIGETSADGRFTAFGSSASDLVVNDTNGTSDVFVRDLQMETTTLVSVNRVGTGPGNGFSFDGLISANGRFVIFHSDATDLVTNDSNNQSDVFVRDLQRNTTTLVSVNRFGTSGNGASGGPLHTPDGRFVTFLSAADDLVSNDTNGIVDLFVRDLQMQTTRLVNVNRFGSSSANGSVSQGVLSADGRFVAFDSSASDLVSNDTNGKSDVFVHDLQLGITALVSVNQSGSNSGNGSSSNPRISADGRFVLFHNEASDLVPNDTNGAGDVFVRDLRTGTTKLVTVNLFGKSQSGTAAFAPSLSANGRFVAFESDANDLVANDSNGTEDVFVRDLQMETTTLVSVSQSGTSGNGFSGNPRMTSDGRFVVFVSGASDLVPNDTNGIGDIFLRDLQTGTTTLVTLNRSGTNGGNGFPGGYDFSGDGHLIVFTSGASDLVANDANDKFDVFVRPVPGGKRRNPTEHDSCVIPGGVVATESQLDTIDRDDYGER